MTKTSVKIFRFPDIRRRAQQLTQSPNAVRPNERLAALRLLRRLRFDTKLPTQKVLLEVEMISETGATTIVELRPSDLWTPKIPLAQLIDASGWSVADRPAVMDLIVGLNEHAAPEVTRTSLSGWRSTEGGMGCFVTPSGTFGEGADRFEFDRSGPRSRPTLGATKGSLAKWQVANGSILEQSSAGIALAGAVFASTLLEISELPESFILLLVGRTTSGKSTLQIGAMSLQGAPSEPINPASTERAIHEEGGSHNGMMLPFGDLSELSPVRKRAVLHHLTYGVSSTGGRKTSQQVSSPLANYDFKAIVVATSELSARQIAKEARYPQLAGEKARCFDLVPAAGGFGFFDMLRPEETRDGATLAEALKSASSQYYGTPLRTWIAHLSGQSPSALREAVRTHSAAFIDTVIRGREVSPVRRRAASKFSLLYAALMLAAEAGVLTWRPGRIRRGVCQAFEGAMSETTEMSSTEAVALLKETLNLEGAIVSGADEKTLRASIAASPQWLGVKWMKDNERVIGLRPRPIRARLGDALASTAFAALESSGMLVTGKGQRRWQVRIPGSGKPRLYQLRPEFLD